MNSMAVLEEVAAGKISPEEAAARMISSREESRRMPRPNWIPAWAWIACAAGIGIVLAVFGFQRQNS